MSSLLLSYFHYLNQIIAKIDNTLDTRRIIFLFNFVLGIDSNLANKTCFHNSKHILKNCGQTEFA